MMFGGLHSNLAEAISRNWGAGLRVVVGQAILLVQAGITTPGTDDSFLMQGITSFTHLTRPGDYYLCFVHIDG